MTTTTGQPGKIFTKDYFLLMAIEILVGVCSIMSMTTMVLYGDSIGLNATQAGAMSSVFAFFSLAGRPFSSRAASLLGYKRLLIVSNVIYAVCPLVFLVTDSMALQIASRAVSGFVMALSTTASATMVSAIIPKDRFARGIGYFTIGSSITTAMSAGIGIWLIKAFGYGGMFLSLTLMMAAASVLSVLTQDTRDLSEGPGRSRSLAGAFEKKAVFPTAMNLIVCFVAMSVSQVLPFFALERSWKDISFFYVVSAVGVIIPKVLAAPIERLMKNIGFLLLGCPMMIASFVILQCTPYSYGIIAASALLYGMGNSAAGIAFKVSAVLRVPPQRLGAANATFLLAGDIGYTVAPLVWGGFMDSFESACAFCLSAAAMAACLAVSLAANAAAGKEKIF